MKYIETELKKRKGIVEHEEQKVKPKNAEDCLYELPENIRVSSAKKTEEMLSNQMLSGIPEVDLGIEYVPPLGLPLPEQAPSAFQLKVAGTGLGCGLSEKALAWHSKVLGSILSTFKKNRCEFCSV